MVCSVYLEYWLANTESFVRVLTPVNSLLKSNSVLSF